MLQIVYYFYSSRFLFFVFCFSCFSCSFVRFVFTMLLSCVCITTMDDFTLTNLYESRNEWCSRLVNVFTPLIIEGIRSIFNEAWKMCLDSDELDKYLMTFQNLLCRVPKWNSVIVENERMRIIEKSGCNYLEDLITCVHIIQLKVLTCIRVGNKQKKIDITIPKLDNFIHKVYIAVARKVYSNVYLFEKNISPLEMQKNNRELELIVQECILKTIRESIPTTEIIRAYLDESVEHEETVIVENVENPELKTDDVVVGGGNGADEGFVEKNEVKENAIIETPPPPPEIVPNIQNVDDKPVTTQLKFNDLDMVLDENDIVGVVDAPKSAEQLEKQSIDRLLTQAMSNDSDDDDDDFNKIKIMDDFAEIDAENLDLGNAKNNVLSEDNVDFDFEELA